MTKLHERIAADFAASGLDHKATKKMRITEVGQEEWTAGFQGPLLIAARIPYFDLHGQEIDFWRYKVIDPYFTKGSEKLAKYIQPTGTKPRFYLPPFVNWEEIASNPKITIWITEGEKKAARMCLTGFPTIGLGGVWNFRSSQKNGGSVIEDFNLFDWEGRQVNIAFDSDA